MIYRPQADASVRLNAPIMPANEHALGRDARTEFRLISAGFGTTGPSVVLNALRCVGLRLPAPNPPDALLNPLPTSGFLALARRLRHQPIRVASYRLRDRRLEVFMADVLSELRSSLEKRLRELEPFINGARAGP